MKLDPTLKHIGTALHRRLADAAAVETPRRIADLLERLSRSGQNGPSNTNSNAVSGST